MRLNAAAIGLATALALALPGHPRAGEARVVAATALAQGDDLFRIDATVAHGDTGWDHYADAWRVETPDGTVLGERTLFHPHVEEQPFTRSLASVAVPEDVTRVLVRARDSVHGWAATAAEISLPMR